MTSKDINSALVQGKENAVEAVKYLLKNKIMTISLVGQGADVGCIHYDNQLVTLNYNLFNLMERVVKEMINSGETVYQLKWIGDNDVNPSRTYSCKKKALQNRINKTIKENIISYMLNAGAVITNQAELINMNTEDFKKSLVQCYGEYGRNLVNMMENMKNDYKIVEYK